MRKILITAATVAALTAGLLAGTSAGGAPSADDAGREAPAGSVPTTAHIGETSGWPTSHYNVWGGNWPGNPPGNAHAYGDVTWYGKHRFQIDHHVNDICVIDGNDGHWSALTMDVLFVNGDLGEGMTVKADRGGCVGNGKHFSRTIRRQGRIRGVYLTAVETNGRFGYGGKTKYRKNPHIR